MIGSQQTPIETALYIHIPFCEHKCIYCDFYSITDKSKTKSFLSALEREINFYAENYSSDREIVSLFFGGGTPSILSAEELSTIISLVKTKFNFRTNAEVTIESNPGTLDDKKIRGIKGAGVNRLSIGVQSFKESDLKFLSRIHNSDEAVNSLLSATAAGFTNINIDLIFGLPGQTKESWKENLKKAVSLPVTHISAYSLIVEEETPLFSMVESGKVKTLTDEHDAEFYETTIEFLAEHGFQQYEVSNFCKTGFECEHNNAYWRYKDYISFGPSAHSFANGIRWSNYSSLEKYTEYVNSTGNAIENEEILTGGKKLFEYLMLAMRSKGIELTDLEQRFGSDWLFDKKTELLKLKEQGFLDVTDKFIKFTPKGYSVCDEILTRLL